MIVDEIIEGLQLGCENSTKSSFKTSFTHFAEREMYRSRGINDRGIKKIRKEGCSMNAWAAFFFPKPARYVTTPHLTRSNSPSPIWHNSNAKTFQSTPLFARGCENIHALFPPPLPRIFERRGRKGVEMEITSGPRQRFDEVVSTNNLLYARRISMGTKEPRGSLLGDECLASFECSHEIRCMISKRDHKLFDASASLFPRKRRKRRFLSLLFEVLSSIVWIFGKFVPRFWLIV